MLPLRRLLDSDPSLGKGPACKNPARDANPMLSSALERAAQGVPLSDPEALDLTDVGSDRLATIMAAAGEARDRAFGRVATFSPKVFLPLTNICRNRCDYCSFRRSPGDAGAW